MPQALGPTSFAIGIVATLAVLPFVAIAVVNLLIIRRGWSPLAQVVENYLRRYPIFAAVLAGFIGALSGHTFWSFGPSDARPPAPAHLLADAAILAVTAGVVGALLLGLVGFGLDELVERLRGDRGKRTERSVAPALGAYAAVGLFGAAYGIIKLFWPHTSSTFAVVSAILIAAPLALGLLWPRLGGFKAFGFEVTLSQVTVRTNPELVSAITIQQYFSGLEHLIDQLKNTIARPETEVIEVDLRDGSYWWPTRLYLLATLAEEFSNIATLVFVDGGFERRFVGMADPSAVRRALATNFTVLENVYRDTLASVAQQPLSVPDRIAEIVRNWPLHYTGIPLEEHLPRVSRLLLNEWLEKIGRHLVRDSVSWSGITDQALYRSLVLDYRWRYVALLRDGRLDRLVNRLQLAVQLVETAR